MSADKTVDSLQTRLYIARMCQEMRDMARRADLPMLAYLLDMARVEAEAERAPQRGTG